jgi:hypothetical protein
VKKKLANKTSEITKQSVEDGKKIINIQKKLTTGKPEEKKEKELKDAEQWRNEG